MHVTINVPDELLERFFELGETPWTVITEPEKVEWEQIKQRVALAIYWKYREIVKERKEEAHV